MVYDSNENKRLGYKIVAGLGARGYRMAVGSATTPGGEAAVKMLNAAAVDAFVVPLDVTSDRSVAEAAQLIERQGGCSTAEAALAGQARAQLWVSR